MTMEEGKLTELLGKLSEQQEMFLQMAERDKQRSIESERRQEQERLETEKRQEQLIKELTTGLQLNSSVLPTTTPKTFNGGIEKSCEEFLDSVSRYAKLQNIDDHRLLIIFPSLLAGTALTHYNNLPEEVKGDLARLKASLRERFSPASLKFVKRTALYDRKMAPEEDLEVFLEFLLKQSKEVGLTDNEKLSLLIQNIREDIKEFLLISQPENFVQAVEKARLKFAAGKAANDNIHRIEKLILNLEKKTLESTKENMEEIAKKVLKNSSQVSALRQNTFEEETQQEYPQSRYNNDRRANSWANDEYQRRNVYQNRNQRRNTPERTQIEKMQRKIEDLEFKLNQRNSNRPGRTSDGRPICFSCNMIGHTTQSCFRNSPTTRREQRANHGDQSKQNHVRFNEDDDRREELPSRSERITRKETGFRDWTPEPPIRPNTARKGQGNINVLQKNSPFSKSNTESGREETELKDGFVLGKLHGKTTEMLLDTGAALTCIHPKFYATLNNVRTCPHEISTIPGITGITGDRAPVLGIVHLKIEIDNYTTTYPFTIVDIDSYDVVLGQDFLFNTQARIDFKRQIVELGDPKISVIEKSNKQFEKDKENSFQLELPRKINLKPASELTISKLEKGIDNEPPNITFQFLPPTKYDTVANSLQEIINSEEPSTTKDVNGINDTNTLSANGNGFNAKPHEEEEVISTKECKIQLEGPSLPKKNNITTQTSFESQNNSTKNYQVKSLEELRTKYADETNITSITLEKTLTKFEELSQYVKFSDNVNKIQRRHNKFISINKKGENNIKGNHEIQESYHQQKAKVFTKVRKKKKLIQSNFHLNSRNQNSIHNTKEITSLNGPQLEKSKFTNNDKTKQNMTDFGHDNKSKKIKSLNLLPTLLLIILYSPIAIHPFLGSIYTKNDIALIETELSNKKEICKANPVKNHQKSKALQYYHEDFDNIQLQRNLKHIFCSTKGHSEYFQEGHLRCKQYENKTCKNYRKNTNLLINLFVITMTCLYFIENSKRIKEKSM